MLVHSIQHAQACILNKRKGHRYHGQKCNIIGILISVPSPKPNKLLSERNKCRYNERQHKKLQSADLDKQACEFFLRCILDGHTGDSGQQHAADRSGNSGNIDIEACADIINRSTGSTNRPSDNHFVGCPVEHIHDLCQEDKYGEPKDLLKNSATDLSKPGAKANHLEDIEHLKQTRQDITYHRCCYQTQGTITQVQHNQIQHRSAKGKGHRRQLAEYKPLVGGDHGTERGQRQKQCCIQRHQ